MSNLRTLLAALLVILSTATICGQKKTVSGKVTDASTGDPIPLANVIVKGTDIGTTTDFTGAYQITLPLSTDSLIASYIGYLTKAKPVAGFGDQVLNFQLIESVQDLDEVVFVAEENPAFSILRNAVDNKPKNNKLSLSAYEYESYTKIEIDLDNLTDKFRDRKIIKRVKQVIDSVDQMAGEDGQAILPLFISESISDFYYRSSPELKKEFIRKTKISGIGIEDGTLVSQVIGSTFQEYNFYQNWLNIWNKEFVSPVADGWQGYYDVYLMDSLDIDGHFCYRLDVIPKREGDLAFNGSIWITKAEYAIKQLDLSINKVANLNFIEKLKIQQELEPTAKGPWIPVKTRVLTDFHLLGEFGFKKEMTGILAKFFTSNKKITVNQPHPVKFYDQKLELSEEVRIPDDEFWEQRRHVALSPTEKNVMIMIDTMKQIPPVKRATDLVTYLGSGYIDLGRKFEAGPYPLFYANNNIEGSRIRFGGRTTIDFSNKWILNGYLAYGTRDETLKYGAGIDYILSRKPWTVVGVYSSRDIQQIGLTFDDVFGDLRLIAFETFYRNLDYRTPYSLEENRIHFKKELHRGLNQKVILRNRTYKPINLDSTFNYAFQVDPSSIESELQQDFQTTEIMLETRFSGDERWIQNDNQRVSLGTINSPILTFRYTLGMKGFLGGDFTYHKVAFNAVKSLKMGFLGVSDLSLTGSKIFGAVPLPLLSSHIGNESPYYIAIAYNTMGFSEYVSDTYASLNYQHHFEGFLLNRIPIFKKLKWRTVATMNVLKGSVSDENLALHSDVGINGESNSPIRALGNEPYVEVGYGIENIFRILRIDAIHRLTYLEDLQGDKFALKFSLQFSF
ncbi:MAG: membrane protein [Cyclobacteriaceae bacterium]|nr:MAG: membrane protein [Cyclobacteriaceae bacterium]